MIDRLALLRISFDSRRLKNVETGHRLPQKLILGFNQLVTFREPLDVVKLFMYRPEYFGKHFCNLAMMFCAARPIGALVSGSCSVPSRRN